MKKMIVGAVVIVAAAVGAIFIVAQTRSGRADRADHGKRMGVGMRMGRLDLSAEQKAKVDEIRSSSRDKVKTAMDALKANRDKLKELTRAGEFDEAAVTALANEQGALHSQMTVERARVRSQTYALLTDEQRAKFDEMGDMGPGSFGGHGKGRRQGRHGQGHGFRGVGDPVPAN